MKILLADDEPCVVDFLVRVLQRAGHNVTTACDGHAALNTFDGEAFDLVMTDLSMPGLDGLGVAKAIKTKKPGQTIVLLTGSDDDGVLPQNVDFVLQKPMTLGAIAHLLERVPNFNSAVSERSAV